MIWSQFKFLVFFSQYPVLQTSHCSPTHCMLFLDPCAFISFMILSGHVLLTHSLQQEIKPLHDTFLVSFQHVFYSAITSPIPEPQDLWGQGYFLILFIHLSPSTVPFHNTQKFVQLNWTESRNRHSLKVFRSRSNSNCSAMTYICTFQKTGDELNWLEWFSCTMVNVGRRRGLRIYFTLLSAE